MKPIAAPSLRYSAACLVCFLGLSLAQAQNAPALVVKVGDIDGQDISESERDTLERMVASYVVELGNFKVIDAKGTELALSEQEAAVNLSPESAKTGSLLSPDFVLSGKIGRLGDAFVFSLENTKVKTGEKKSVYDSYPSVNDIVLKARSLTRRIFGAEHGEAARSGGPAAANQAESDAARKAAYPGAVSVPAAASPLSLTLLIGTWSGDKGIETIRIYKGGKALATMSSGLSLRLKASVQDGRYLIEQDQPNVPALYASPSYSSAVAKEIAQKARPMRWIFQISEDRKTLSGIKESVAVQKKPGGELIINNEYAREAVWTRDQ
jgi:hypothetical protein